MEHEGDEGEGSRSETLGTTYTSKAKGPDVCSVDPWCFKMKRVQRQQMWRLGDSVLWCS